jgi:uncharacterized membrane protein
MSKNVGAVDRGIRALLGLVLLSLVFVGPKTMWGLVGIVLLATAWMSFCPLYTVLGMNTRPKSTGGA